MVLKEMVFAIIRNSLVSIVTAITTHAAICYCMLLTFIHDHELLIVRLGLYNPVHLLEDFNSIKCGIPQSQVFECMIDGSFFGIMRCGSWLLLFASVALYLLSVGISWNAQREELKSPSTDEA